MVFNLSHAVDNKRRIYCFNSLFSTVNLLLSTANFPCTCKIQTFQSGRLVWVVGGKRRQDKSFIQHSFVIFPQSNLKPPLARINDCNYFLSHLFSSVLILHSCFCCQQLATFQAHYYHICSLFACTYLPNVLLDLLPVRKSLLKSFVMGITDVGSSGVVASSIIDYFVRKNSKIICLLATSLLQQRLHFFDWLTRKHTLKIFTP